MELPLATRELTRLARRPSTYVLRMLAPAAAFAVFGLYFQVALQPNFPIPPDAVGRNFVNIEVLVVAAVIFLGLPFLGAATVAQEKQERTLGLLLLADLSGWDIFLAKLLAVIVYGLAIVASVLPILMFTSYFGAVTWQTVSAQAAILIVSVVVMCTLSLLWSTVAPDPRTALFAIFGCLVLFLVVSSYLEYLFARPLNPIHMLLLGPDDLRYWLEFVILYILAAIVLAGALLALALRAFPAQAYAEHAVARQDIVFRRAPHWLNRFFPEPTPMAAVMEHAMAPPGFGARRATRRISLWFLSILAIVAGPFMLPILIVLIIFDVATNMRTLVMLKTVDDVRLPAIDDAFVPEAIHDAHFRRALPYLVPTALTGVSVIITLIGIAIAWAATPLHWLMHVCIVAADAAAYGVVAYWLIRCLISLTCDCSRKEHRPSKITSIAVGTIAGYFIAFGYIMLFPIGFFFAGLAFAGAQRGLIAGIALLLVEFLAVFVLRRAARDYQRMFTRFWERDIDAAIETLEAR